MSLSLTLPWPPSLNTYWRSPTTGKLAGRTLLSEAGRRYRQDLIERAQTEHWGKVTIGARLSVQIDAWMPDKRRRDLDNVLKATLDGLTHAGVWEDDSQIDHLSIRRVPTLGGMLKIQISELV